MKKQAQCFIGLTIMIFIFIYSGLQVQSASYWAMDTLKTKETRKAERDKKKLDLQNSHSRYRIMVSYVYAKLDSKATFQINNGIFNVSIGLEDNLGLPGQKNFFTGGIQYRITPRSGIYAIYYGINREKKYVTDQEYYFRDDTIAAGSSITTFFGTRVISVGYMLTVVDAPNTFLGFYFNIYLMNLYAKIESNLRDFESKAGIMAPLPNFGLVAEFKITEKLYLNGALGFFSFHTDYFGGGINSYDLALTYRPLRWFGFSLSYKQFDINMFFKENAINTTIEYNFRGPSVGMTFVF